MAKFKASVDPAIGEMKLMSRNPALPDALFTRVRENLDAHPENQAVALSVFPFLVTALLATTLEKKGLLVII